MFSAGEASGDLHAAKVIARLARNGEFECFGMGAGHMQAAGARVLVDSTDIAIMGIVNIARHYFKIRRALRTMEAALAHERPDLLVTVDYPEFNMRLAATARKLGIKVLMYIAPQIWAWRPGRITKIARLADRVAVILPFEKELYARCGVAADYVGHPLVEAVPDTARPPQTAGKSSVLLLPGSRETEIRQLMPIVCRAAVMIKQSGTPVSFRLLKAAGVAESALRSYLQNAELECEITSGGAYDEMRRADVAISACGTAILQLALCETPAVVIYKISRLNYAIAKRLVKTRFFCLPNIIAGRAILPELIQDRATPERIRDETLSLLNDAGRRRSVCAELAKTKERLGTASASENVARIISEMTTQTTRTTKV